MIIKNLDTGEEYVIGENDPDFEYDNFPLRPGGPDDEGGAQVEGGAATSSLPWYVALYRSFFGNEDDPPPTGTAQRNVNKEPLPTKFTKLSMFKFRRELGKGAFGRVLLAEAKTDGQLYALKIISKKNMGQGDRRQAMAERDILHAMSHTAPHPFTTGLKFAFQSENNLYLGMEYLSGGNLKQLIQRFGTLPEEWVVFYAAELVLAISHLHSLQVLYRDIKPHNVMLDGKGHIILIDYGLSKQDVDNPTGAMSLVGTPDYSAPEVLRTGVFRIENEDRVRKGKKAKTPSKDKGEVGYGMAADWWSVGVMIFEMLAGLPTFRGKDLRQTYQKVLYADVSFTPEDKFSPHARELLLGLIHRDPEKRLGTSHAKRDVKKSTFFRNVNWDDIYARVADGPWRPDSDPRASSSKKKKATSRVKASDMGDDDDDEIRDSFASEIINVRESIIQSGKGNEKNRLEDWSFMDQSALTSAAGLGKSRF